MTVTACPHASRGVTDCRRVRYGLFLRPSAELIERSLRAYRITGEQFGFSAANAYAPHITLVGSITTDRAEREIVDAAERAVRGRSAVYLVSGGMRLHEEPAGIGYQFSDGGSGSPVSELMGAILEEVRPLRHFHDDDLTAARRRLDSPSCFSPHLSIISFDGGDRPELVAEAHEVLEQLGITGPAEFVGDRVHLFRFTADDWGADYWNTLTWDLVRTLRLDGSGS